MKAPFPWFGGKSRAASLVWERLGDVSNYVEPFAGSLAVLLARPHEARIETVNDKDAYVANFWRALQAHPDGVALMADWPVNEADLHARHRYLVEQGEFRERMIADPDYCDVKIAGWWVWGVSQWIGGGWCSRPERLDARRPHLSSSMGVNHVGANRDGLYKRPVLNRGARGVVNIQRTNDAAPLVEWMRELRERLRRVRVCCGDWSRVVTPSCTWNMGGGQLTGVFLDPPYSHDLRDNRLYSVESDVADECRAWALENGDNDKLRIVLCGLKNEHKMPTGWKSSTWNAPRGMGKVRDEVIWFSPHCLDPRQIPLWGPRCRRIAL
jgi:DNA adenine methylase